MRRGSTLIASLMVLGLLFVIGLAFLGKRAAEYRAAERAGAAAQARALAEAGLEDLRLKAIKDYDFPPRNADEQLLFVYSEDVFDTDGVTFLGTYTVSIDRQFMREPYGVWRIRSVGSAGPREAPLGRCEIYAELDIAEHDHQNLSVANPRRYEFLVWRELGGL